MRSSSSGISPSGKRGAYSPSSSQWLPGSDREQMLGERRAVHRREEAIGEHETVRVRPIVRDVGPGQVGVPEQVVAELGRDVPVVERPQPVHAVEAVHPTAVDRHDTAEEAMREVVRKHVRGSRQGHDRPRLAELFGAPDRRSAGAPNGPGIRREVVVEAAVLLHDEHDVLDGAARSDGSPRRGCPRDLGRLRGGRAIGRTGGLRDPAGRRIDRRGAARGGARAHQHHEPDQRRPPPSEAPRTSAHP
jgi:hypothetical protein